MITITMDDGENEVVSTFSEEGFKELLKGKTAVVPAYIVGETIPDPESFTPTDFLRKQKEALDRRGS